MICVDALQRPVGEIFEEISPAPIASASLGQACRVRFVVSHERSRIDLPMPCLHQVYKAKLRDGPEVAVKVQFQPELSESGGSVSSVNKIRAPAEAAWNGRNCCSRKKPSKPPYLFQYTCCTTCSSAPGPLLAEAGSRPIQVASQSCSGRMLHCMSRSISSCNRLSSIIGRSGRASDMISDTNSTVGQGS